MVKKIVFLTVFVGLVTLVLALISIAPYHIYTLTLTEGVSTQFLEMKPSPSAYYDGEPFYFFNSSKYGEDSSLYSYFHFSNFDIPMPYNHPLFFIIPSIKIESNSPRLGINFQNGKNLDLLSFVVDRSFKFETITGNQKLFLLPIFKNNISRKSEEQIWNDIFSKKLTLPSNLGKSFYHSLLALKEVTYYDLVYNLYILYNRSLFFPNNIKKISFDNKTKLGLVEIPSDDPMMRVERLYILEKGIIYPLTIKTRIDNTAAENLRTRILKGITYKNSTVDSAIPIYAQYKNISYGNRIDQQGMTFLYSAWSHDPTNKDYIRVIILFLERGKLNLKFLKPFYEYAFKKFGSNLSSENNGLLETAEERLKRREKEELEAEINKEKNSESQKYDGDFSSADEKIKYYLKKAKDSKTNTDESEKILIQE